MALSANTAWEVRPTNGLDTNSGGFVAGASGTDWSQQNSPQYSVTDGVTAGTTTITSATANFGTDVVGNIMYVQGGTGSVTAGWYQITVRNSASSVTVDRSTGLTAGTGVTLHIGGALKTLSKVSAVYTSNNKIFVKAEATMTITAGVTFSDASAGAPSNTSPYTWITGYTTTRGDGGQAAIALSTNTGLTAITLSGRGILFENFTIDCASLGTSIGLTNQGNWNRIHNVKISNATSMGLSQGGSMAVITNCEVTGTGSLSVGALQISQVGTVVFNCNIHDNACAGIQTSVASNIITHNLIVNNTGGSSDGIIWTAFSAGFFAFNTIYGNGRDGIRGTSGNDQIGIAIKNNILENNGAYGIRLYTTAGTPALAAWDGNAFYNNTSGARFGMDDTSSNPIDGVSPYVNSLDVINTTGSFFTNAAGGDFTLNNTANQGALIRGHGTPGAVPGVSQVGYPDFGCFQHQDAGGLFKVGGMAAGMQRS